MYNRKEVQEMANKIGRLGMAHRECYHEHKNKALVRFHYKMSEIAMDKLVELLLLSKLGEKYNIRVEIY